MRQFAAFLLLTSLAQARPNTPGSTDLFHYAAGETIESFPSAGGNFRIWFTRSGADAVSSADANMNGTPDDVEQVADLYEQVLAFYLSKGFRQPPSDAQIADNGGDGRFDVYLLDFGGASDGSFQRDTCDAQNVCIGYSVHENDFVGYGYPSVAYGNRVLASHEFFHAVQAAYDASEDTIVSEGTATWATEQFDPTLSDFEAQAPGYLSRTDHSLDVPMTGPVDAFSYGSCVFFEYLSEKFGDAVIQDLWTAAAGSTTWFAALPGVLETHQSSYADAFAEFSRWNLFTNKRANPMYGYARGSGYTLVTFEADAAPLTILSLRVFPSAMAYLAIPPAGRAQMEVSLVGTAPDARMAIAVRTGNVISAPILADDMQHASAATDGADELLVVVANTAQMGESEKPALCAGDADETAACVKQLTPAPPVVMGMSSSGCDVPRSGRTEVGGNAQVPSLFIVLLLGVCALRSIRIDKVG
jgi:hypothetical protein